MDVYAVDLDRVRVLVVGDSGVGKSSLVHLCCHGTVLANPSWTIGAAVDVRIHEYMEGTPQQKAYFVEFFDVGGKQAHSNSRSVFYHTVHGIVLVHDLTNRKSNSNLSKWMEEVTLTGSRLCTGVITGTGDGLQSRVPVLVVGTKLDQLDANRRTAVLNGDSEIAEEFGAEELLLDCTAAASLAPGSGNAVKLSRFYDRVLHHRYHRHSPVARNNPTAVPGPRRNSPTRRKVVKHSLWEINS